MINFKRIKTQQSPILSSFLNPVPYLCGHDEAGCSGIDCDVPRHQPHILELLKQFPVLLVAQRLDRCCVDHSLFVSQGHCNSIPDYHNYKSCQLSLNQNKCVNRKQALKLCILLISNNLSFSYV